FLGNSTGTLARIFEDWSMSWIVNVNSGAPLSVASQSMLYANGTAALVGAFDPKAGKVEFPSGSNSGSYFGVGTLSQVRDPQCAGVSTLQGLQGACTLNAVADTSGRVLLQNPLPGTRGTLGINVAEGPGRWRFDANIAKVVRLAESKTLQFRVDATNVFNHPEPNTAANSLIMDINNANFGSIIGVNAKSELRRQFQAQLRFNF
ncbi:MAG: hypothetical protein HYU27_10115, partial [Acidobacteria bacterium]|nr:hypothetical protein [Acidobacteriota bacterium]